MAEPDLSLPDPTTRAEAEHFIHDYLAFTMRVRRPHKDWLYNGPEGFLEAHGRFFDPDCVAFPHRGIPKQCFDNAYRAARAARGRYHYCEGIAFKYIPTLHAWLIDDKGRVIDPTWEDFGLAYFGVELDLTEVRRARLGGWCSVLDDWKRHFPAARGVPVIAQNAWFSGDNQARRHPSPLKVPDGICSP